MSRTIIGSLARIADFEKVPYDINIIEHPQWGNGDYVLGEITGPANELYTIETCTGEMLPVHAGDEVIGALGRRAGHGRRLAHGLVAARPADSQPRRRGYELARARPADLERSLSRELALSFR